MSMQLQSTSTVLAVSLEETEPLTAIKNEPLESKIDIDDIPNSLDEEIIADVKEIDIVSHELSEDLIKSETISENEFENNYSGSVETQVFVKTENIPLIKTENITQSEYLHKTQDTKDRSVNRGTSQGVIEVQGKEGSNEHFNALKNDKQFANFFKDLSDISRKAKCLNKKDFSECYKTIETTSCEKDKKKGKVIEVPVIPIEPHKYTSLAKKSTRKQNKKRYCCEKCTYTCGKSYGFKLLQLAHKTKSEIDDQLLKYRCDKCKYKTCRFGNFKRHKLIHLKPEQIPYFCCYHCSYKSKQKCSLQQHIFCHFKNEEVSFHCYICNFTTLKRNLIIEHFKKHHSKHHSKCDERDYKNQLETYTKKQMRYCCEKCTYTCGKSYSFKLHQLTHKTKAEIDDQLLKYRCDKCKYKTYMCSSLKVHKLTHLKPEEIHYFYCYHCPYKCKQKSYLKIHIFNHFKKEEVPFYCYICDFRTLKRNLIIGHFKKHPKHHSKCNKTNYKNHFETHQKTNERCCEKYTYTSGKSSDFKRQQITHETIAKIDDQLLKYHCDECKYKTYSCSNLKAHKISHLKPEEIHYFYCYHCSYKSKWKHSLKYHIFGHFKKEEIPFHCYICDFTTLKRNLIIEHFKKHPKHHSKCDETDYKSQLEIYNMRYSCDKCMYTCGQSSHFKRHQLIHKTKAKIDDRLLKYRCDKCKFKTCWFSNLKNHKLTHLKPEEIQYFYCYYCSFKSKRKGDLKTHIFNHFKKEEALFHCYICDFTTLKRNRIIEHLKKHPKHHSKCDETDYKNQLKIQYFYCYHCTHKSKRKRHLKTHIFRHFKNEDVPFHCYICDFITLKRESFKKHLKHHNRSGKTEYRNQLLRLYKIL